MFLSVLSHSAGRGEIAKFRALMDRHAPAVHRVVYRMLGDINEAKDVTQETFLRIWKQSGGFPPK